jgi:sulfate transport system ATP-binding protein
MSIQLNNISKRYSRDFGLENLSLTVEQGELFVLLGASGSGKSTILRLIAGLLEVDSGQILLNDRDVTRLPPQKRDTGFVFQNYSLFAHLTVAQNIEFGLKIRKTERQERQRRIDELLKMIGLQGYRDRLPHQLSGGQQQRVALARALAPNPSVLLLDEPFGALDVKIRAQLRQNLRQIQQEYHVTTILVTHDQEEAFELADRIGVIDHGELLEIGTPTELYRRPRQHFTATFLGTANLLPARRNGTQVYVNETTIPALPNTEHLSGQPVDVLFRPEAVELALSPDDLHGYVLGAGVIEQIAFAGVFERVSVRLKEHNLQALISYEQATAFDLQPGKLVFVGVKDYHLLPQAVT